MAKKRWLSAFLRYPRTRQEIRANQDRNDPYVRGRRRKLPTAYDDQFVRKQKSWKYLRRKTQYREKDLGYDWHEFEYSWRDCERRMIARNIMNRLDNLGCFYEYTRDGIRWFGPENP
jgi:hypothetical protein